MTTNKKNSWGKRQPMRDASEILAESEVCYLKLKNLDLPHLQSVAAIKSYFSESSRSYYSLAAMSRRKILDENIREAAYKKLFSLRALLEKRIHDCLVSQENPLMLIRDITTKSFFGGSIKQGVSIRYPLSTCVPTATCGGRCYAHDGRDRDYDRLFRGVLNGFVGIHYELNPTDRESILSLLSNEIDSAIKVSRKEATLAAIDGFNRSPRIRFSHVGELAATPVFANDLALEIKRRSPDISCVIYTRHPQANILNRAAFVVNFTVEGVMDKRVDFYPKAARLVSSSWDGEIFDLADVNFLEHHVEKSHTAKSDGNICPVTVNHKLTPTCDSARCEKCFIPKVI